MIQNANLAKMHHSNTETETINYKYPQNKYDEPPLCGNCGKQGHLYRNCNKPITSYGIICFRKFIDSKSPAINISSNAKKHSRKNAISNHQLTKKNYQSSNSLTSYISDPEIILIQRKHTIGYMELIRGKYDPNNEEYLVKIFDLMTQEEKDNISSIRDYDILRNMLGSTAKLKNYKKEYYDGKQKFSELLKDQKLDIIISKSNSNHLQWDGPEWGLPKGRRSQNETDLDCAIREFLEETGIDPSDIIIYQNIIPLEEIYTGINNILYKHVYFIARMKETESDKIPEINIPDITMSSNLEINYITSNSSSNLIIDHNKPEQFNEVSNIKWCNFEECNRLIRPYYTNKISVIKKAFQMIKNLNGYFE